jgi:hypothetical protein
MGPQPDRRMAAMEPRVTIRRQVNLQLVMIDELQGR